IFCSGGIRPLKIRLSTLSKTVSPAASCRAAAIRRAHLSKSATFILGPTTSASQNVLISLQLKPERWILLAQCPVSNPIVSRPRSSRDQLLPALCGLEGRADHLGLWKDW